MCQMQPILEKYLFVGDTMELSTLLTLISEVDPECLDWSRLLKYSLFKGLLTKVKIQIIP